MITATSRYAIGVPGVAWGAAERAAWLSKQTIKRSYQNEVVQKLDRIAGEFDIVMYGALSHDEARYPLFAVKSKDWDVGKPYVLITGGVHGYETSGVQGALHFLHTKAKMYAKHFNVCVAPCVSPWAYETIQRWNAKAIDPNRSFWPGGEAEECRNLMAFLESLKVPKWTCHIDLHETTDTDESEFSPAKAARDGVEFEPGAIPDGFYLVADVHAPQLAWQAAMIEAVRRVTHIAPSDAQGCIIGNKVVQDGVILYDTSSLHLCSSVTKAAYCTTTEVYPDSPSATDEQCNDAQVACVCGGLDFLLSLT